MCTKVSEVSAGFTFRIDEISGRRRQQVPSKCAYTRLRGVTIQNTAILRISRKMQPCGKIPLSLDNGRSPHVYKNQRLQIQFRVPDDERYAARNMLSLRKTLE